MMYKGSIDTSSEAGIVPVANVYNLYHNYIAFIQTNSNLPMRTG